MPPATVAKIVKNARKTSPATQWRSEGSSSGTAPVARSMAAHFVFVYGIFVRGLQSGPADWGTLEGLIEVFQPLWPALLALAVSHGVSFGFNFIRRREYVDESIQTLMLAPYNRIVVMHVTILLGGAFVLLLETPLPALVLLVLLKTAVDARFHGREHVKAQLSPQRAAPARPSP